MTSLLPSAAPAGAALPPGPAAPPAAPARRRRPGLSATLALTLLPVLLIAAWALFPGLFTGQDPISGIPQEKFQSPTPEHWFGTDHLGRDVFARVVHGTSQTFLTAGLAVLIGLVAGTLIGVLAATGGRAADTVTMRLVDVLLAVPGFLIALIIVTASAPGPVSLGIGVGIAAIASFARVVRAEVLRVRNLEFVEAAFLTGGTYWTVLRRHLLPNAAGPVLSLVAVDLGAAILVVSSLGFLGFGAPPPEPEWGLLIAEGRQYLGTAWWMTTLPGLVIVSAVVMLAAVGRQLLKSLRF